jgi:hypothetical protein
MLSYPIYSDRLPFLARREEIDRMLIKQHHLCLYLDKHVLSFVVEELIWSDENRWPDKYRLTVKPRSAKEKTFYGPTPDQLVREAIRYICRQEVSLIRLVPSLRKDQTRSGTNGD